jgi:hypothetical protein
MGSREVLAQRFSDNGHFQSAALDLKHGHSAILALMHFCARRRD